MENPVDFQYFLDYWIDLDIIIKNTQEVRYARNSITDYRHS